MIMKSSSSLCQLLSLRFLLLLLCCGALPALAQTTLISTHTDSSGKISIAIFEKVVPQPRSAHRDITIEVAEQYLAIGGGLQGSRLGNGHFLTASHPNQNLSAWQVSSKDHLHAHPVAVRAFAIGLKISGLTREQLRQYISVNLASSAYSATPQISTSVPKGYTLISGGFRINYFETGSLATASYPHNGSWHVSAKEHITKSPASVQAFAIGILSNLPKLGYVQTTLRSSSSSLAAHPASSATLPPDFALSGCGAKVDFGSGAGNLIWKINPYLFDNHIGCEAASKDMQIPNPASITTYALGLSLR